MGKPSVQRPKRPPLGAAGWIGIAGLGGILGAAIWLAFYGWHLTDAAAGISAVMDLVWGGLLSILLGGGLMALAFWSNRKGYDR